VIEAMRRIEIDQLPASAGAELGSSGWRRLDQGAVDAFAELTGDRQWIHLDPERAVREGLGGTIVHGFFTLSLLPQFINEVVAVEGSSKAINYGLEKARFPASVPVGGSVRGAVRIESVTPVEGGYQIVFGVVVEAEGVDKPVCVAQTVARFYE
jgi:acyl dehydratase